MGTVLRVDRTTTTQGFSQPPVIRSQGEVRVERVCTRYSFWPSGMQLSATGRTAARDRVRFALRLGVYEHCRAFSSKLIHPLAEGLKARGWLRSRRRSQGEAGMLFVLQF